MDRIKELSAEFDLDERLTALLYGRGFTDSAALKAFLYPEIDKLTDISLYKGAASAAERIKLAVSSGERILIYGDYDCDGICSVSILYLYLKSVGSEPLYYIPNRKSDGYGLNLEAVERLAEEYFPDLIVTVDTGISAVEEISEIINGMGIDVIVTDHHIPGDKLPDCVIFNPKLSEGYPDLAGAGVALRLIEAIAGREEMLKYIDIAAIATIADIVPLTQDNRIIAYFGIEAVKKNPRRGIKFLLDTAKASATASDIAYKLAPRINASGRLTDANKIVEIFISEDYFLLQTIVREADNDNTERRRMSDKAYSEALELLKSYDLIDKRIIVLLNETWDAGVLGIAAARVSKEFNRPAILFTKANGAYKGSGRSIEGVNLFDVVSGLKVPYSAFGGHSQALGVTIECKYINEFIEQADTAVKASYQDKIFIKRETPDIILSGTPGIKLFKDMERMEPYGQMNRKPSFEVELSGLKFSIIGNNPHIKAELNENVEILLFNGLDTLPLIDGGANALSRCDINISKYNGAGQCIVNSVSYMPRSGRNPAIEARYLKQMLYKDTASSPIKVINDISEYTISKPYGTLFIASREEYAIELMKAYPRLKYYIGAKPDLNPENAVIVAPSEVNSSEYYKDIVFLDTPLTWGYADRFNRRGDKKIYFVSVSGRPSFNVAMDKERLETIFNAIKGVNAKYVLKSLDDLYYKAYKVIKSDYLEFAAAFYILYELKAVSVSGEFEIRCNDTGFDPNKSAIYRRINEH